MQNESEKWVSCYRGIFPDVPIPLNPDGSYKKGGVAELIEFARKECGNNCPFECGFRKVAITRVEPL
jgi:hypothetical protein